MHCCCPAAAGATPVGTVAVGPTNAEAEAESAAILNSLAFLEGGWRGARVLEVSEAGWGGGTG